MRAIENKAEKEKKQKRNQIVIGGILIALMVLSTAGYATFNNSKTSETTSFKYNGLKFENINAAFLSLN